jgi:hypothetical protein
MAKWVYDMEAIKRRIEDLIRARDCAEAEMFRGRTISRMGVYGRRRNKLNNTINKMQSWVAEREC